MGVELRRFLVALALCVASPAAATPPAAYTFCGWLQGANFNTTADQAIYIDAPSPTYALLAFTVANPSRSMTLAAGGLYTAPGKTGLALVPATQAYSGLTTNALNAAGYRISVTPVMAATNLKVLYFSLTTAQGAAATADLYVHCAPLL